VLDLRFKIEELGMTYRLWVGSLPTVEFLGRVLIEVPRAPTPKNIILMQISTILF